MVTKHSLVLSVFTSLIQTTKSGFKLDLVSKKD